MLVNKKKISEGEGKTNRWGIYGFQNVVLRYSPTFSDIL